MSLQELRYSDSSPVVEWHYGQESEYPWASFGLVDVANFIATPPETDWRDAIESQLNELLRLRSGWDGFHSGPISRATAAYTISVLDSVMRSRTPAPAIVPAHGGAVQLEWHQGGLDIELMIYRPMDAELTVHFHDNRPSIAEVALTAHMERLSRALEELV